MYSSWASPSQPRAEKQQYDVWGALNNDSSWTWDGLLPFFKSAELATPPNKFQTDAGVRFDPSVHGFSGRVQVGFPNFFFEQAQLWEKTVEGLGFKMSPDLGNGDPHAVGIAPNSIDAANNTRCVHSIFFRRDLTGFWLVVQVFSRLWLCNSLHE